VVKAVLIGNDADVAKPIQEHERSELVSIITIDWDRFGP